LGHPEWKDEPRFRDNAARYAHRAELEEAFLPILAAREREEWRRVFLEKGVPCASVNSLAERLFEKSSIGGISSVHCGDECQPIPYRPH
jgi:crotonobetainyl-CoA:carnitine CoA-transferase CaiB-like acyl-CoA transferase